MSCPALPSRYLVAELAYNGKSAMTTMDYDDGNDDSQP